MTAGGTAALKGLQEEKEVMMTEGQSVREKMPVCHSVILSDSDHRDGYPVMRVRTN